MHALMHGEGETIIRGEGRGREFEYYLGRGDDGNDGEAKMHLVIRRLPYGYTVQYMHEFFFFPPCFDGDFLNYKGRNLNLEFGR